MNSPRIFCPESNEESFRRHARNNLELRKRNGGLEPAEQRDLLLDCGDSGDEFGLATSFK